MRTKVDRPNRFFAGPPVKSFNEAFPTVRRVSMNVKEVLYNERKMQFDENNIPGMIRCSNPLCEKGGFEIDFALDTIVAEKLTNKKDFFHCIGHENMGNRNTRRCVNALEYEVQLEYFPESENEGKI